jgi:hypothetical protein
MNSCASENPARFPWAINTTFEEKIYTRWCCIDRLSWQRLPGTGNSFACASAMARLILAILGFSLILAIAAVAQGKSLFPRSDTSVTVTGVGTDVFDYSCAGNAGD